jgi:hypothetical protein
MKKLIISVGVILCGYATCFAENKSVNTIEQDSFFLWLIAIAVAIVAMSIAIFLWLSFRKRVIEVVEGSKRISDIVNNIIGNIDNRNYKISNNNKEKTSSGNLSIYEDKIQQLDRRLGELKTEVDKLKASSKTTRPNDVNKQYLTGVNVSGAKFFRSKQGKFLTEEVFDSREAKFKVSHIRENEASFEYCGTVVNADFFTDVCGFENNPQDVPNKTRIETTVPGRVRKDVNNNWEVINPAKIKFE